MMDRSRRSAVLLLLLAPLLAAGAEAPCHPEPGDLVIGVVGSLSGPRNAFGIANVKGARLAIAQANDQGRAKGHKLVLCVRDDEGDPQKAIALTRELIEKDHATVILGEADSSVSLAMAGVAQKARVPMISPSSTNPAVTAKGDFIFRACFTDPFQGQVMARFAWERGLKRVAILEDEKSRYSQGLTDFFSDELKRLGGQIVLHALYAQRDPDFSEQLKAIQAAKPDALYVPGYYPDAGTIAHQAHELGLRIPLLGGDGWDSPELSSFSWGDLEGGFFSTHFSVDPRFSRDAPAPEAPRFIEAFKKANGGELPDAQAALAYDAARLAIDALRRAPALTGPALRDALAATKGLSGVTGPLSFDPLRDPLKPAVVLQVTRSGFRYIRTVK